MLGPARFAVGSAALLVIGCGIPAKAPAHAPAPSAASTAAPTPAPPPLFAALFDRGRVWTYETTWRIISGGNAKEEKRRAACHVETVIASARCWESQVTCDATGFEQPVAQAWLATPSGLWLANDPCPTDDAGFAALGPPLLTPNPVEGRTETHDGEAVDIVAVKRAGSAWCHESTSALGDEGYDTVCLEEDVGVTRALVGTAGASVYETEMTLVRP